MHNLVVINCFNLLDTNCEPHGGTQDFDVTVCLQRGSKGKSYFEGAPKGRAPGVLETTKTMDNVGGHGAKRRARTQLKGHHKKGICVDA